MLLDLDALAEGHEFFSLGGSSVSPDGTLLAYSTDVVGDERYTIRVKDLATGELLADEIAGVIGGATWDRAGEHLYYTTVDESWRADKIWRHRLGTAQADDELVHHETDGRFWVGVGRTRSDRFLVIAAGSKTTSEYRFLDADAPDARLPGLRRAPRGPGVLPRARRASAARTCSWCCTTPPGPTSSSAPRPIAPTPAGGVAAADRATTPPYGWRTSTRSPATSSCTSAATGSPSCGSSSSAPTGRPVTDDYLVEFDHEVYTVGSGGNPGFDQPTVRLGYTTMAVPSSVYDYDVRTRELTLLKRAPVLGGYDPADYEEHRLWATADDGEQVPISIVCRRGAREDDGGGTGPVPTLLYGYGAYETSIDPYFSIARLSLLDRGAAFAIAHVRGGGEMGRRWYDDGKLLAQAAHLLRLRRLRPAPRRDRLDDAARRWSPRAPAPAGC